MSSGVELENATSCGAAIGLPKNGKQLPMDLLDEYWFFNNTLNSRKVNSRPPKTPPVNRVDNSVAGQVLLRAPSFPPPHVNPPDISNKEVESDDNDDVALPATLMRAPSMPSPYINGFDDADHKETQHTSNTQQKGLKSRHATSNLGCHHSWHPALEKAGQKPRLRRQHSSMSSSKYCLTHSYRFGGARYREFQDKKWRSSSDLESIEVQGFKDLGFVFDKKELKEGLVNVIPGLREKNQDEEEDEKKIMRPYLSEAWYVQRSVPPSFDWREIKKSKAEMKDQLRFWARAVACNVRQEC